MRLYIDYVNVFSGGDRQIVSQNFRGGKISAVFGGIELDLTKAKLAPGVSVLEIACVFGGATIIVPDDWYVTIEVTPVLGGFSDSRKLMPGRTIDSSKHLLLKGAVVLKNLQEACLPRLQRGTLFSVGTLLKGGSKFVQQGRLALANSREFPRSPNWGALPPLVLVCVDRTRDMHDVLRSAPRFALSVLAGFALARRWRLASM